MRAPSLLAVGATVLAAACLTSTPSASAMLAPGVEPSTGNGLGQPRVLVTPDLNGDHRDDLLVTTSTGSATQQTVIVTARSGRSGARLWQRRIGLAYGGLAAYPVAHLGAGQTPGVMLVAHAQDAAGNTVLAAQGIGSGGRTLWTYSTTSDGDQGLPSDLGPIVEDGRPGLLVGSEDLAVSSTDSTQTGNYRVSIQPRFVDGRDGSARDVGSPVTASDGYAVVTRAPDLDGDCTSEVVGIVHERGEDDQALTVRDGASGEDDWTTRVPGHYPSLAYVQEVGDVDGDGTGDLVEQGYDEDSSGQLQTLPATLLDGASGRIDWSKPGYAEPLGDRVHAVALLGYPVQAVRADGSVLWSRQSSTTRLTGAGDVQDDATLDLTASTPTSVPQVLAASTGAVLWQGTGADGTPLGAAVDGKGDDLASLTALSGTQHGVVVATRSGDRGRRLWTGRAVGVALRDVQTAAGDLTGDGCAEVVAYDGSRLVVLGGADGVPIWSLVEATGKVIAGHAATHC